MSQQTYGPYSPVRVSGQWVFVSGQVGVNPDNSQAATDVETQTEQVLKNLTTRLETVSSSLDRVVKTTIFLKNVDDFAVVNEIYGRYFSDPYPARSCVEVASLPRVAGDVELLVEIEAIAERGESS